MRRLLNLPNALSQLFLVIVSLFLLSSCSLARKVPTPSKLLNYWVELGPNSQVLVRAVVAGPVCPSLSVDALYTVKMTLRSVFPPAGICEAEYPRDAKVVTLDDNPIVPPKKEPKKIIVLGDSGCRIKLTPVVAVAPSPAPSGSPVPEPSSSPAPIKWEGFVQDCAHTEGWPFAKIAKNAAKWSPDLVIHVGDYHYRETDCPEGNPKCEGAIGGDRWGSWRQDFFEPAEPLLEKAPWIFVRGNHENCARGGLGWFKVLDPRPYLPGANCNDRTLPYVVGSNPPIAVIDATQVDNISPSLARLSQQDETPPGLWLALHRPFMGAFSDSTPSNTPLPKLSHEMLAPGEISLILAGHLHRLTLTSFNFKNSPAQDFRDKRPLEIISGNAGANLDPVSEIKGPRGHYKSKDFESEIYKGFGFLSFEKQEPQVWTLVAHDPEGLPVITCKLREGNRKKSLLLCR